MREAKIVTLYKNNCERSDYNNDKSISLLSVVGKPFARVLLIRLQKLAKRIYPESQCGFRAKRSTVDMVFSLRQLKGKCREQQMPLYASFIDLTKAFDLVSRDGLFKALRNIGCSPKLHSLIESVYSNMKGTVQFNGSSSEQRLQTRLRTRANTLEYSSLFSSGTQLALRQRVSTCEPDQTTGYSTSPASKPRRRSARPSSETCCLLTTQQLQLTPSRNCSR